MQPVMMGGPRPKAVNILCYDIGKKEFVVAVDVNIVIVGENELIELIKKELTEKKPQ